MRFDVLTLFPEMFSGYLSESILKLAQRRRLVSVHTWNIRDWAAGKHKQVDDRPFGGGPGMVLMAPPAVAAVVLCLYSTPRDSVVLLTLQPLASNSQAEALIASAGGHVLEQLKPLDVYRVELPADGLAQVRRHLVHQRGMGGLRRREEREVQIPGGQLGGDRGYRVAAARDGALLRGVDGGDGDIRIAGQKRGDDVRARADRHHAAGGAHRDGGPVLHRGRGARQRRGPGQGR